MDNRIRCHVIRPGAKLLALREFVIHESGLSSATIVSVLVPQLYDLCLGKTGGLGNYPLDPDDFVRCKRALDLIPNGAERLAEVSAKYPEWGWMVREWPKLMELCHQEIPKGLGAAPKLYAHLKMVRGVR